MLQGDHFLQVVVPLYLGCGMFTTQGKSKPLSLGSVRDAPTSGCGQESGMGDALREGQEGATMSRQSGDEVKDARIEGEKP